MRSSIVLALVAAGTIGFAAGAPTPAARAEVDPLLRYLTNVSCTRPTPCQEGKNAGTGAGVEGISAKGKGVIGQTTFKSTSAADGQAGVLGQDLSTSGSHNIGLKGTSTGGIGIVGVAGSPSGLFYPPTGMIGDSQNGDGVHGYSVRGAGIFGDSVHGVGVIGFSGTSAGVDAVGGSVIGGKILPALSVVGNNSGGDFVAVCASGDPCDNANAVFRIDGFGEVVADKAAHFDGGLFGSGLGVGVPIPTDGNVDIAGQYRKNGTCVAGCTIATTTSPGRSVQTYAPTASEPIVEDVGEAQLVNGQAYVRLDPRFANIIQQDARFFVFITPEGDAGVLFVTQKSVAGFAVRESHGGRSTVPFSYRIVAKPLGSHEPRLPMISTPKLTFKA